MSQEDCNNGASLCFIPIYAIPEKRVLSTYCVSDTKHTPAGAGMTEHRLLGNGCKLLGQFDFFRWACRKSVTKYKEIIDM